MSGQSGVTTAAPVAFVTPWRLDDPRAWSGMIQPMLAALRGKTEVVPISTHGVGDAMVDRMAMRVLDGRGGKRVLAGHLTATSRRRGQLLGERLRTSGVRAVVGVAASQDLAHLRGWWPVLHVSDATFRLVQDFYPLYSSLEPWAARQGETVEQEAIDRATSVVTASEWARASVMNDYGKSPKHVTTIPFGPGIDAAIVSREGRVASRPLRVLMVSSNWERKGGRWVLETVAALRDHGHPVELTVIGDHPTLPSWALGVGPVTLDDMASFYATHDVLLELALANAAGVTLTDAAHAGLPVVATQTGGTATIVVDGETGILVSVNPDCVVREAVAALRALALDAPLWTKMSARARAYAVERLSWDRWAREVVALINQAP